MKQIRLAAAVLLGLVGCGSGGTDCTVTWRDVPGEDGTFEEPCAAPPGDATPEEAAEAEPEEVGGGCVESFRTVCQPGADACEEVVESCDEEKLLRPGFRVPRDGIMKVNILGIGNPTIGGLTTNEVLTGFNNQFKNLSPAVRFLLRSCNNSVTCREPITNIPEMHVDNIRWLEGRDPVIPATVGLTSCQVRNALTEFAPKGCTITIFLPTIRDVIAARAPANRFALDVGVLLVTLHELGHMVALDHYSTLNPPTRSPMSNRNITDEREGVFTPFLYASFRSVELQEVQSVINP